VKRNNSEFGFYRVSAVSPELRIANPEYNTGIISHIVKNHKSDLFVFPELSITAYSCQDLFFQSNLLESAVKALIKLCKETAQSNSILIVGAPLVCDNRLYNTAVVISGGEIIGVVPKSYLCNANEYYEERWFASGFDRLSDTIEIAGLDVPFGTDLIFENSNDRNFKLGIEICEDMWSPLPPAANLALSGATIIANLSASNEYLGKSEYRSDLIKMHSGSLISAYIYSASGLWESTSDTVFSGKSMIFENAALLASTKPFSFESEICTSDIDLERLINERMKNNSFSGCKPTANTRIIPVSMIPNINHGLLRTVNSRPFVPDDESKRNSVCCDINDIQVAGLSRRLLHTKSKSAVVGVSGGLDSTLALLVIYNAFKKINLDTKGIIAVTMPGFGTTKRTKNNAVKLAGLLGITLKDISIEASVRQHFNDIGHDESVHDIVYENAQARRRTHILMDLANMHNGIVIGTGDLSESALGWCTFNGDHISMYAVNSGVPKTLVKYMIEWYSKAVFTGEISDILLDIINTPISPELLPPDSSGNIIQDTENSIGPYLLHDFFLYYMIRHGFKPEKILFLAEIAFSGIYETEFIAKTLNEFVRRFFTNQFKRNVVPDGIKIGTVALSPRADWRMPSEADYLTWITNWDNPVT